MHQNGKDWVGRGMLNDRERIGEIKGVIFDLDGTLIDTDRIVLEIVNKTLTSLGLPSVGYQEISSVIDDTAQQILRQALDTVGQSLSGERFEEAYKKYSFFAERVLPTIEDFYPDVVEGLVQLKRCGFNLSICTNKNGQIARKIIQENHLSKLFSCIVGEGDVSRTKPDKAHVLDTIKQMGLNTAEVVFVGNSHTDKMAAEAAGVLFYVTQWGGGEKVEVERERRVLRFLEFDAQIKNIPNRTF